MNDARHGDPTKPVNWSDICRTMIMFGMMKDNSLGECRRIKALLEDRIAVGKVKKDSEGKYRAVARVRRNGQ
jgi:hypothetical protein